MKTHTTALLIGGVIFLWGLKDIFVITNADWTFLLAGGVVMAYGAYSWIDADEVEQTDGEALAADDTE